MIHPEVKPVSHDAAHHAHPHHPHHHDAKGFVRAVEHASEERGLRLTPLRKEVLELIAAAHKPIKAYDLLDLLRERHGNAAPPTVYRALDFLVEEGLIHRLDAVNAWAACLDAAGQPHDLLVVCTRCGAVAELSDPELSRELARKVAKAGFVLAGHETELQALCGQCSGQGRQPAHHHSH